MKLPADVPIATEKPAHCLPVRPDGKFDGIVTAENYAWSKPTALATAS